MLMNFLWKSNFGQGKTCTLEKNANSYLEVYYTYRTISVAKRKRSLLLLDIKKTVSAK